MLKATAALFPQEAEVYWLVPLLGLEHLSSTFIQLYLKVTYTLRQLHIHCNTNIDNKSGTNEVAEPYVLPSVHKKKTDQNVVQVSHQISSASFV